MNKQLLDKVEQIVLIGRQGRVTILFFWRQRERQLIASAFLVRKIIDLRDNPGTVANVFKRCMEMHTQLTYSQRILSARKPWLLRFHTNCS